MARRKRRQPEAALLAALILAGSASLGRAGGLAALQSAAAPGGAPAAFDGMIRQNPAAVQAPEDDGLLIILPPSSEPEIVERTPIRVAASGLLPDEALRSAPGPDTPRRSRVKKSSDALMGVGGYTAVVGAVAASGGLAGFALLGAGVLILLGGWLLG